MGNGLVSGICINLKKEEILLVKGLDDKRYKLPGGRQKPGEDYIDAMIREWEEETGHKKEKIRLCELKCQILRNNGNGCYTQYTFLIEVDNPERIRVDGIPGENGPPEWVPIKDIGRGLISLYPSHLRALRLVLNEAAMESEQMAFLASEI